MPVSLVPAANVDQIWPAIGDFIHAAVMKSGGDLTAGYLWQECRSGQAFLILAFDEAGAHGASVWRFENWQTGSKFRCLALGGNAMADWIGPMRDKAQELARQGGASALIAEGREGWTKVFTGARKLRILYEEAL